MTKVLKGKMDGKNSMRLLILLVALSATTVKAQDILSCESRVVDGYPLKLDFRTYKKFYPTIIFSEGDNSVTYVFSNADMQSKEVYNIHKQNEDSVVGISNFNALEIEIFHYDKRQKTFHIIRSNRKYATTSSLTIGRCFD